VRSPLAIALLIAFIVSLAMYTGLPGDRETGIFPTEPPTPYFHYKTTGTPRGQILVVHGLNSGKNVMNVLSYSLAEAGFEVFAVDLPGHGDSAAPFNAIRARDVVASVLDKLGPQTIVLGHSLGGAILLDLANERTFGRMVLFSPAPTTLQTVQAEQVFVLEGRFDPSRIRAFIPRIETSTTGSFEVRALAWTGHSGGLFRSGVVKVVAGWLGGDVSTVRTRPRLLLIALTFVFGAGFGLTLLKQMSATPVETGAPPPPARLSTFYYVLASLGAAVVLAFVNVAAWLRVFAMDYLIGFVFLAGAFLCIRCRNVAWPGRRLFVGVAAAAYLIGICGGFGGGELFHFTLSEGRPWRFVSIFALSFPLFLADEVLLRPLRPAWKATCVAILTRIALGAVAVSAVLIVNRQSAFLVLLGHLVVLFWIALWFATWAVRKRTDPVTAACFAALVQGWGFAAIFVTV
jgi:pimeloyl-ACP methyl ester carboxylesterase